MSSIKQFVSAVLMGSITFFSLLQPAQSQSVSKGVKNVVLVHGAFADGSSWSKVIAILHARGFNAIAVQNPLTSVAEGAAAARRAIAQMDGPVLLVGHSYGGMVVSEAGNDPKVAGLLYVCALIPDNNEAVVDVLKPYPPAPGGAEFQQDATGFLTLSLKGINEHFAQDLNAEDRWIVYATQGPWAVKATTDKVSAPAWKTKPSWCIIGQEDHMVIPELARAEAKMIKATTLELKSSHVPMLSQPDKVAAFIIRAAGQL